jgi:cytochrome b pre-mRNA-processing protein 3
MVFRLFRRRAEGPPAGPLYEAVMAASRRPFLFAGLGVPDTVMGRFESLTLHAVLVVRRLKGAPEPGPALAQALTDRLFAGLDAALREIGIGDLTVPKRMKDFAAAFLGRAAAYGRALDAGDRDALAAALARNIYGGEPGDAAARLADLALATARSLDPQDVATLAAGGFAWPAPDPQEGRA